MPIISEDGNWRWDGTRWVANVAPKRPHRWPWIAAIAALLAAGVSLAAISLNPAPSPRSVAVSTSSPATSATARTNAPPPKATGPPTLDADHWMVTITNVRYDAASGNQFEQPETGNVFVTLDVTFRNNSGRPQNANSTEFVLHDPAGIAHTGALIDSAPFWSPVDVAPGATFGPRTLAFEATAGHSTGLVLVWTPILFGRGYSATIS